MSRKSIRKLEKIFSQEDVKGIKKDQDSGKWKLVTQQVTREQNSGEVKSGELIVSDALYEMCSEPDSEVKFSYEDIDGLSKTVYLKLSE